MAQVTGIQLRDRRIAAGLVGLQVCGRAGITRGRLSDIERAYVMPRPDELARLTAALDDLIASKNRIDAVLAAEGWPAFP
jgi:transcriptional regulator with XRE-family HTH domain